MARLILTLTALLASTTLADRQPQPPLEAPLQRMQASIGRTVRSVNASWGIYVKSLETGEEIAVDADRQMETMSTIKIPLMDLMTLMIIVSDNTATDVLYRMVGGPDAVTRRMEAMGLKSTRAVSTGADWFAALRAAPSTEQFYRDGTHPFGLSTPREMGSLLERMERGTLVDKSSSDLMLQIMRGQLYRTRIPRYVTGYRIPHKTGDFLPYVGDDVGMLEAPGKTIIVSIFTGHHFGSGEALENAIGLVAKEIADYFSYRQ